MAESVLVLKWLQKADEDFDFATSILDDSEFYAQICFHFHQAAEKYLKAMIIALDLEFKKIHDLPVLLKSCMTQIDDLNSLMGDCKFLNRYYLDTRYPVLWPTRYDKGEALKAKQAADILVGEQISEEHITEAAQTAAYQEIEPTDDIHAIAAYKRHLANVLGKRALIQAVNRAKEQVIS